MQATPEQIELLEQLQEIDRTRIKAESKLKDMPHRQQVLDGRAKRKEVQEKYHQVSALLVEAKNERQKLLDEDQRLAERQEETQAQIDTAGGDYRKITTLTRELEGMVKRRETLAFQDRGAKERVEQVSKVYESAADALAALDEREQQLVADFHAQSEVLATQAKEAHSLRAGLISQLPEEIAHAYEEALSKCGGIGLARLQGEKCSACRTTFDSNRLLQLQNDAPLSYCPHCKRLLIV